MAGIYNTICSEAGDAYRNASAPIISYIRSNFSGLNITVSNDGQVTLNTPSEDMKQYNHDTNDYEPEPYDEPESSSSSSSSSSKSGALKAAGAAIGAALGSIIPGVGTLLGGTIGGALVIIADSLFRNSNRGNAEYERRLREVEAYNERQARKAEEENRRRQDARTAATNQINAIVRDLRASYVNVIEQNFNGVMNLIDEAIARISKGNAKIQNTLESLKQLRGKISNLRRQ